MSQYNKLYTAQDTAVVFVDHQPQMLFGVSGIDRAAYINNVTLLARAAKEFNVPTVLTAVETEGFSGYVFPQLLDVFPGQPVVERSSMNSWDDPGFRKAVEATGRKKHVASNGPTTAPERPRLGATRLVHEMVEEVLVLREEPGIRRCVIVRADHRVHRRVLAKVGVELAECLGVDADISVQE